MNMLIVLPPSETKAPYGTESPLVMSELSYPELTETRTAIAQDLMALDSKSAREILKLSDKQLAEVEANRQLFSAPTMPAIYRYTGVLYDALDPRSLSTEALSSLAVGSALFGLIKASDNIPHYRLSGSTKLPVAGGSRPTMKARWGTQISDVLKALSEQELVLDFRSGVYQQLGALPALPTVRVEKVAQDGSRKVISHFNKHYKGLLARTLIHCDQKSPIESLDDVLSAAADAGFTIELRTEGKKNQLVLVV